MLKIINGLKLDVKPGIETIQVVRSNARTTVNEYSTSIVITGAISSDFTDKLEVVSEQELLPLTYTCKLYRLTVGTLNIEAFTCLPTTIIIATVDRSEFKVLDLPDQLIIACPRNSTENDLVNYINSNPLVNYSISGGSNDKVGNILYRLCEEVTRPYDSYGEFTVEQYAPPTIDVGLVVKYFNKLVRSIFPDFGYVITGDQSSSRGSDYIEYTIQDFGKYGRTYVDTTRRHTLLETVRIRLDIVTKDTVKYMNILHSIRTHELLVNNGTYIATDNQGNNWKCAIDWGDSMSDSSPGQVRGNYGKQAGNLISIDCSIRYFSIPDSSHDKYSPAFGFYPIEEIIVIYKFLTD